MKRSPRRRIVLTVLAMPVAALLAYAWVDGGREPLREIEQNLPVPVATSGAVPVPPSGPVPASPAGSVK